MVGSLIGLIVLFGYIWLFIYYFCNGVWYLFWDMGVGFKNVMVEIIGVFVIIIFLVMILFVWVVGVVGMGGG